ncbi:MAG: hypothetical protein HYV60_23730 [Planctomycetia bacterium]|nr:hypothetical protein [Planctomycetia bacterium]
MEILQRLFNWQDEELRDFLRPLASLFPIRTETGHEVVKPYHKSLTDWLSDEATAGKYFVSVIEGHRLLGEYCFDQWQVGPRFAISEVVYQLQFDTTSDRIFRVFLNPTYYETKFSSCGWDKLYDDLACIAAHSDDQQNRLDFDDSKTEIRALFSIAALILFKKEVTNSARILRRFIESGCDRELLEDERAKLRLQIPSAEESNPCSADTAHYHDGYLKYSLKAEDAALALKPTQMLYCLSTALRFRVLFYGDSDPVGAVRIDIQEAEEAFEDRVRFLQRVWHQLDTRTGWLSDVSGAGSQARKSSSPSVGSRNQVTNEEFINRSVVDGGPRTYSGHGAWCDMVDYGGRGYPQDMDFVCQKCGHCAGVGTPTEVPPACPKCGNDGGSRNQGTNEEFINRSVVDERSRTYSGHGAWCDMVDYGGRGYPQDMDFVCQKCGHCVGVGTPTEVPPACPKCGNDGGE